jgi:hypothetical protein
MNKPIEEMWQQTKESIYLPPDPGNDAYFDKLRLIYFAGARALYHLLLATDEEDTDKLYDELHIEFEEFKQKLQGN